MERWRDEVKFLSENEMSPERGAPRRRARTRVAGLSAAVLAGLGTAGGGALVLASAGTASAATLGTWTSTGELATGRTEATATLLGNGMVLVAGGKTDTNGTEGVTATSELYNPTTGSWAATGSMPIAVGDATAELLSNGQVLVVGGETSVSGALSPTGAAELYNPTSGTWSSTQALPSSLAEYGAVSAVLSNGDVLVAGGATGTATPVTTTTNAELYSPSAGTWAATGALPGSGVVHATATSLSNGNVLVAGGETDSSGTDLVTNAAEVFSGSAGTWSATPVLPTATQYAAATQLSNGAVLVAGGSTTVAPSYAPTTAAQLYNPSANSWSATGSLPGSGTFGATATLLANGNVLYAGGLTDASQDSSNAATLYSTSSSTWTTTGTLLTASGFATSTLLSNGNVLVAGGETNSSSVTGASELYFAGVPSAITSAATANFAEGAPGSFTVTVTGAPDATISEAGALPAGLTFVDNKNNTATISGMPLASGVGTFPITVTATNGVGASATQSLSIVVASRVIKGYWYVTSTGSVQHDGAAPLFPTTSKVLPHNVVAIAPTPDQAGYYLASSAGNIYNYGDAKFYGSKAHARLTKPVVAFGTSPDAKGYYLVTSAGNIYNYGDAKFYGSPVHVKLTSPIVAFALTADGKGYWLATSSGTVYAYGDAHAYSTLSVNTKVRPIVAMASSIDGNGYYLITSKGNVYNYGDARFFGSLAARKSLPGPITAIGTSANGVGYYLVSSKGNIYNLGTAPFFGSSAHTKLPSAVTGFATFSVTK